MKKITVIIAVLFLLSCKKEILKPINEAKGDSIAMFKTTASGGIQVAQCGAGSYSNLIRLPYTTIYVTLNYSFNGSRITSYSIGGSGTQNLYWLQNSTSWAGDSMGGAMNGWVMTGAPNGMKTSQYNWSWNIDPASCMLHWGQVL